MPPLILDRTRQGGWPFGLECHPHFGQNQIAGDGPMIRDATPPFVQKQTAYRQDERSTHLYPVYKATQVDQSTQLSSAFTSQELALCSVLSIVSAEPKLSIMLKSIMSYQSNIRFTVQDYRISSAEISETIQTILYSLLRKIQSLTNTCIYVSYTLMAVVPLAPVISRSGPRQDSQLTLPTYRLYSTCSVRATIHSRLYTKNW